MTKQKNLEMGKEKSKLNIFEKIFHIKRNT